MSVQRAPTAAIIPMRGGSKGLPGKNLALLNGEPLLNYTVRAALASKALAHVVVSTDADDIASHANMLGVEVLRHPPHLSTSEAPTAPVVTWALSHLIERGDRFESCMVLRATTPFRTADDIDEALALFSSSEEADSLVSVVELIGAHPIRLKQIDRSGWLVDPFTEEGYFPVRRQELPSVYIRNGGIYLATRDVVQAGGLWGEKCIPYVMPPERSVNINSSYDMLVADLLAAHHARHAEG